MSRVTRARRIGLSLIAAASLLALTGCFSSSNGGPTASPEPTAIAEAQDFCGAMDIAKQSADNARGALSSLYDEMATDDITDPGHDLTIFTTAGADVVAYGTAYLTALEQLRTFADEALYEDIDAISEYWETYAVAVGDMAASAESYSSFVDASRELIEAPETAEMRTAQIEATDNVNREYAKVCSSA